MKPETFFDNFEVLADAPNGVQKLRELILQLAVQGKLVPQDENDEPASILLERIIVERKKLFKEGKIKETGKFPIENEDMPFELPPIWKWTCLYEIGIINPRNIAEDDKEVSFIPMTLISETSITPIDSEKRRWGEVKKGFTHFAEGDIVLAKITPCFQNGKSAVMRGLINNLGAGTTELHVFRPILNESVNPEYVLLYLRSPQFLSEGIEKMTGTAGQKRVPKDYFEGNPFPLPPLAEQHRIIAKVNQLMSLCDELEARQQKKRESRALINSAALNRLLAARAPGEFAHGWRYVCDNFDLLYDTPENVGALRQAILQLAFNGKLVKQDENDEPASVLFEKIKTKKEKAIKEKKIKRTELQRPIEMDEVPNELPRGWLWVRLGDICFNITDGFHNTPKPITSGIPYLTAQHIRPNFLDFNNCLYVSEKNHKELVSKTRPTKGDLLVVNIGAGCGTPAIINIDFEFSFKNVAILNRPEEIDARYLYYYFILKKSEFYERLTKGGAQPFLSLSILRNITFPLPPFEEQRRIVAKVNQLMSLCDNLEASLSRSQADGERLMEEVVRVVSGADCKSK